MKKLVLLAVAAVSAALIALPAAASAGEWQVDPAGWAFEANAVGNTVLTTNNNETVICTGSNGKGSYNSGSQVSGTVELTFTGCTESTLGTKCKTAGAAEETITTTPNLIFTNVYLGDGKTTPGITIRGTGAEEHFVSFECGGGLVKIKVTGTVLGHLESACNAESVEHALNFESVAGAHGVQKFTKVTTTDPVEDLTAAVTIFGGTTNRTASQDGTGILKNTVGVKAKVTCV